MLLQGVPKRFSIDIDIQVSPGIGPEPGFKVIIESKGFLRYEPQNRMSKSRLRKSHYKFFYSAIAGGGTSEDFVMLDVVWGVSEYLNAFPMAIRSPFAREEGDALAVQIPGAEEMLGDKLTAFAPNTSGIPYLKGGVSRAMEIGKQLFDIGQLSRALKR